VVNYPPSLSLARLPTPLHEVRNVADLLRPGQRLWIKRDDETGCGTSGNKLRKLDFYAAEAVAQGADALLTSGADVSNHCRATALVARELGMDVALLLEGAETPDLDGNFLLMALVGARVRTVPEDSTYDPMAELRDMAEKLRAEGRRPYIVPPAGTAELGVIAYVRAVEELREQCEAIGLQPDALTVTAGSCSTYAGIVLGAALWGGSAPPPALGFSISGGTPRASAKTRRLIREAVAYLGLERSVPDEAVRILDQYRGAGYGLVDGPVYAFIHEIACRTGLILDPVYTGKALAGVLSEMRSGCLQGARDVVFFHTGGLFGLFPHRDRFALPCRGI